jgi:hypothetical protein
LISKEFPGIRGVAVGGITLNYFNTFLHLFTPSFQVIERNSGINKSDGSPGGTGAKRAQKCSVSKLDRASVIIERINVDKEKEKLRKKIQAGTSTVFKFRL